MISLIATISILLSLIHLTFANVEKVIFLGPPSLTLPSAQPGLQSLGLVALSPTENYSFRTDLAVEFPSEKSAQGFEHWFLLDSLVEGQRYEVRVCWPATQPTEFWLDVYSITHVFNTPSLITSLAEYSEQRQNLDTKERGYPQGANAEQEASTLFLYIRAAADFYTTNATLMKNPPAVTVDIILDPYFLQVLPASLLPTGLYVISVAVVAWFLSGTISKWLIVSSRAQAPSSWADAAMANNNLRQVGGLTRIKSYAGMYSDFGALPSEIIIMIVDYLPLPTFARFLFAAYPLLRHHRIVAALPMDDIGLLMHQRPSPIYSPALPNEIWIDIARNLNLRDKAKFVIAGYSLFLPGGLVPALTKATHLMLLASRYM